MSAVTGKRAWVSRLSRKGREEEAQAEGEKMTRLEDAEASVASLRVRAAAVTSTLDQRRARNHWREAIEEILHTTSTTSTTAIKPRQQGV